MRTCLTFLVSTSVFSSGVKVPPMPKYLEKDYSTKAEKSKTSGDKPKMHKDDVDIFKPTCDEPSVPYQPDDIIFTCDTEDFLKKTVCQFTSETCSGSILCKGSWWQEPHWRSNIPGLKINNQNFLQLFS